MSILRILALGIVGLLCSGFTPLQAEITFYKLVSAGQYDQARSQLASNDHHPLERLFLEGLISKHKGRLEEAEQIFRTILEQNPNLKPVQGELAHTLALMGRTDAASYHFERLQQRATSVTEREQFEGYLRAISIRKPSGFSTYLSLIRSSNINKGSSEDRFQTGFGNFEIDEEGREQSGIGLSFGLQGFHRYTLSEKHSIILNGSTGANIFENSRFNFYNLEGQAHYQNRTSTRNIVIGPTLNLGFDEGRLQFWRIGPELRYNKSLPNQQSLSFSLITQKQRFPSNDARNGYRFEGDLYWRKVINAKRRISLGVEYFAEDANRDFLSHHDYFLAAGYDWIWGRNVQMDVVFRAGRRKFKDLFPATDRRRKDKVYSVSLSALFPQYAYRGFAPRVQYLFTREQSNISFFNLRSHDFNMIFTKEF